MCEPSEKDLLNVGYQPSLPYADAKKLWVANVVKRYHVFNLEALNVFFDRKVWAYNHKPNTQEEIMKVGA